MRGGINIDGTQGEHPFQPALGDGESGKPPFLWIMQPLPPAPTDEQLERAHRTRAGYEAEVARILAAWDRKLEAVEGGALHVEFRRPGIAHINFSDEPFWDGSMTSASRPGKLATIADTRAWVRAFLDAAVRGEGADLRRLAAAEGVPEWSVRSFGKLRR